MNRATPTKPLSALKTSASLAASIGLLEAVRLAASEVSQLPASGNAVARWFVVALLVHALIGLLCGLIALKWAPKKLPLIARANLAPLAGILALYATSRYGAGFKGLALVGGIAAALLTLGPRLPRWRWERSAVIWSALFSVTLVVAVAVLGMHPFHGSASTYLLGVAAIGAAALVFGGKRPLIRDAVSAAMTLALVFAVMADRRIEIAAPTQAKKAPAVLLVTIDTLRWDTLKFYGYEAAVTPNIDKLAKRSVVFHDAISHSPWTVPSHGSILSGLLPTRHGAMANSMKMPAQTRTISDLLAERGYATGAFVSGWPLLNHASRFGAHFHDYDDDLREVRWLPAVASQSALIKHLDRALAKRGYKLGPPDRPAEHVTDSAVDWLKTNGGRPYFAWVHYYDPHLPYEAPRAHWPKDAHAYQGPANGSWYKLSPVMKSALIHDSASLRQMRRLYDAELRYVDHELGRLFKAAEAAAPPEGLVIAVTSDHGESFGEHDLYFERFVFEPTVRVPLLIAPAKATAVKTASVAQQVQLADIAPTLLELAGQPALDARDGRSLAPVMTGTSTGVSSRAALTMMFVESEQLYPDAYSVRQNGHKLIHRVAGFQGARNWVPKTKMLFDLKLDPGELQDLYRAQPQRSQALSKVLAPHIRKSGPLQLMISAEDVEKLRSLGYVR